MAREHTLKTWPAEYAATVSGQKRFDIRWARDRNFQVGDTLELQEYNPETETYTGEMCALRVTFMVCGPQWGIPADMVVMSLEPIKKEAPGE